MVEIAKKIILQDGRTAKIIKGRGRHLMQALRSANNKDDRMEVIMQLLGQLVLIEDKAVVPEEIEDLYLEDFTTLMEEFSDLGFSAARPHSS